MNMPMNLIKKMMDFIQTDLPNQIHILTTDLTNQIKILSANLKRQTEILLRQSQQPNRDFTRIISRIEDIKQDTFLIENT